MKQFPAQAFSKTYRAYKIVDDENKVYIGMTSQLFNHRLKQHLYDKRYGRNNCSSAKLNLDNCEISCLEKDISISNKKEREKYWIDSIECVNKRRLDCQCQTKEGRAAYYQKHKEKISAASRKRYHDNRVKFKSKSGLKYVTYDKINFKWKYQSPKQKDGKIIQKSFHVKRDAIICKFGYTLLLKVRAK